MRRKNGIITAILRRKIAIITANTYLCAMKDRFAHTVYIWQLPNWPNFTWDSVRLLTPLTNVSRRMGQFYGMMSMLGFDDKNKTQLEALSNEILDSSKIEGVILNAYSVRSSVARKLGIEYEGESVSDHYVEGLVDVMLDATINAGDVLTVERLHGWHAVLFPYGRSGMMKITVADWRKGEEPMQVVSGAMGKERVHYQAPPSECVSTEMDQLFDWINTANVDPILKSAVAHLWFVTIHPYDDGNGRIGRTIADMLLSRMDGGNHRYFSMSAEILQEKSSYYDILESTQKGGLDITAWIEWYIQCLENALNRSQSIVESTLRKASYWELYRNVEINERQRKVINRLWDGFEGKLTSSKWAKICHTSQDTALRDIQDLVAKGMLLPAPDRGRSANYILPEV